jgi:hypothetical protein
MSGSSSAKRQAQYAAEEAERVRGELTRQTEELKRQREQEKRKAQRLLMRSLRASGGGFFETDAQTLGSAGVLG